MKGISSLSIMSCHYQKITFWCNLYLTAFCSATFCFRCNNVFCLFVIHFSLFHFYKNFVTRKILDISTLYSFVFCGNIFFFNRALIIRPNTTYRSSILVSYYSLLLVSAVQVSHHQVMSHTHKQYKGTEQYTRRV
jgi:hypothetical protein